MDVDAGIDALIDLRAEARRGPDSAAEAWRRSEIRHAARLREQRRRDWQLFYMSLAASLRASARKYELKAQDLSKQMGANR